MDKLEQYKKDKETYNIDDEVFEVYCLFAACRDKEIEPIDALRRLQVMVEEAEDEGSGTN
jgi:hypothetical protein